MTVDERLDQLLIAATADVPTRHLQAPLTVIHRRVRRRRRSALVFMTAAVTPILIGGYLFAQHITSQATPQNPAVTGQPTTSEVTDLSWVSALIGRDGNTITVYVGPNSSDCSQLSHPQATITEADESQVVIAVTGRTVRADDCSSSGRVVPLVVSTATPVSGRVLRDAATRQSRPTYFERDLPDLRSDPRWHEVPSEWYPIDQTWYAGYSGPNGWVLNLTARTTSTATDHSATGVTIMLGSRQGSITEIIAGFWAVSWKVGNVTYSLEIQPAEGGSLTLTQFKQEITRLTWS